MNDLSKYQVLRTEGADSAAVYRALRADGHGQVEGIRMLREVFSLSLVNAKSVIDELETGRSTEVSQPGLEKVFADELDAFIG